MRSLRREPALLLATGAVVVLTLAFIVYPQVQVVIAPAPANFASGPCEVFWMVSLPLSRPCLCAAILTTAIYIVEDFGNPQLIGGQFTVLPTQAYNLISGFGEFTSAAAVSTLLLLIALALYLAKIRLDGGRSFVTISGRASSMPRPPVPAVLSWACFSGSLVLAGVIL